MKEITARFSLDLGWAVYGSVKRHLENYFFTKGIKYTFGGSKGFPEGNLLVSMTGEESKIKIAVKEIEAWLENL